VIARGLAALLLSAGVAFAAPDEPAGYRMDDFRSPVPASLTGARVVDSGQAEALWRRGDVVFVDVLPRAPKPENLPDTVIWRDKPRDSIPGAIWLPNVGYGAIAPQTDAYFRDNLAAATDGDATRPVLFFCLEDCWMSWNAAKRAIEEYGYAEVYWYPDGTDGWAFEGLPTERLDPLP
jgi:PQQ-dependent catabolism-associated CXXCW motif protein